MTDQAKTVLEWTYDPKSFFEETVSFPVENGSITIAEGKVRGEFDEACYDYGRQFRDEVDLQVRALFMAQQVQVHSSFNLSAALMSREHSDGRRDVTLFAEPLALKLSGGKAYFVIKDANGNITHDSRAERLAKHHSFREAVATLLSRDRILKRLLQSFHAALSDEDNLLIHLYEVRDALVSEFGSHEAVRDALGISGTSWSKFGRLADNEPFLEGRHRGQHEVLRPAAASEIEWVLTFSQGLIEAYVQYRNEHPSGS